MSKIIYILTITLLSATFAIGQQVKKGYKNLEKMEYDKATETFSKIVSENSANCAANFGLALAYFNEKNPAKNYLMAYKYMSVAMKNKGNLSTEDSEILTEYFNATDQPPVPLPVQKKMERENKAVEEKLIMQIREKNDMDLINEIIANYKDYKYYDNVVHIRNYLEFRKAEKIGTTDALKKFMSTYPDAAQVKRAKELIDQLSFEEAKKANSIQALNDFIARYPESLNKKEAITLRDQMAYNQAKMRNTIESYDEFISKYPEASQLLEAKHGQMLLYYAKAKSLNSYESYTDFLRRYPEGREYIDIFNLKALSLGKTFETSCTNKPVGLDWIKAYDNQGKDDHPGGIAPGGGNTLVIAGTTGQDDNLASDAWILKLDASAKMLWNNNVGDVGNDAALDVAVDNQGNILVAGYTSLTDDFTQRQAWLFKLSSDGKRIWNRSLGPTQANAVAINSRNEIIVGGYNQDTLNEMHYLLYKLRADGKKLWSREYTSKGVISDICTGQSDNIYIAGGSWVFILDNDGYIKWESWLAAGKTANAVTVDASGNMYLAGSLGQDTWVAKYDATGKMAWEKSFDNGGPDKGLSITVFPNQNILLGGSASNDGMIMLVGPSGNLISRKVFGNGSFESIISLVPGADNKALILMNTVNPDSKGDLLLLRGN
ncbi:MAG: hypothetical protein JXB49_19885 [Bacteroidales bacterium]|nr:hypothetical protein [Bacteroidales bacterium]